MEERITYRIATQEKEFKEGISLFREYANYLNIDFSFQNFDEELLSVDKKYGSPEGGLIIAYCNNEAIGCVGIRFLEVGICELKRLYVKDSMRGRKVGYCLMEKSLNLVRELGYYKVRLDTLTSMKSAILLYESYGFYEIPPYCYNPLSNARYYEINLSKI